MRSDIAPSGYSDRRDEAVARLGDPSRWPLRSTVMIARRLVGGRAGWEHDV